MTEAFLAMKKFDLTKLKEAFEDRRATDPPRGNTTTVRLTINRSAKAGRVYNRERSP